jgi:peptide deformylase
MTTELTIERLGAPVLRRRARKVEVVDHEVQDLVRRMFDRMYAWDGQGLAAPQVGISLQIAVIDVPPRPGPTYVLVNPRIVTASEQWVIGVEGCLSVPGVTAPVKRSAEVLVEALDLNGPVRLKATGELARCFQHEIDHLHGMLYIDRLAPLARSMVMKRYRRQRSSGSD